MACSLPQFILLKSNKKDKYLRYRKEDDSNHAFLQFSEDAIDENVEIQYVKFEVEQSEAVEGFVHIRSCYNKKYWVRKSGGDESKWWIAAEAHEAEEDQSKLSCTLFKPILVEDADVNDQDGDKPHKIRLVHVDQIGKQEYVALADSDLLTLQDNVDGDHNVFIAYDASLAFANRTGQKSLISRRIMNVNYNLGDSRVYNIKTVNKERRENVNTGSVAQSAEFTMEYKMPKTMVWFDRVWTPSTISASMVAAVPHVESRTRVGLDQMRELTVVFGDEQFESLTMSYTQKVTVPPRTKTIVSVTATEAQCDVPFTCRVVDRFSNGSIQSYDKNDGMYTGVNEFNFTTTITEQEL